MSNGFLELGIRNELVNRIRDLGIKQPTPIQEQAIPVLLKGHDIIGQAQTGTGKTLAFVLPILERIDPQRAALQSLIVTPTRELALQITDEILKLAPVVEANVIAVYGGQDVESQIRKLKGATHIIIATPGRLLDHLRRGTVELQDISMLVLDEADQMLHMGFLPEVEQIIAQTSADKQMMLFSATMPNQIRSLAKRYLHQPTEIKVKSTRVTVDEIEQVVIETTDRAKQQALVSMLRKFNPFLAIIFCRTKRRASKLNEALLGLGFQSDELHGDLSQAKRERVMKEFREARIQFLVATDVAARGLDVEGVTHVFNYDIPHDVESYIHRIGRTGRAGETGVSVTFVAPKDRPYLQVIEKGIHRSIERIQPEEQPSIQDREKRTDRNDRGNMDSSRKRTERRSIRERDRELGKPHGSKKRNSSEKSYASKTSGHFQETGRAQKRGGATAKSGQSRQSGRPSLSDGRGTSRNGNLSRGSGRNRNSSQSRGRNNSR